MWLKRRTPLSILFSGISGGMPALAGRVLGLGRIDAIGLLLAAGILERIAPVARAGLVVLGVALSALGLSALVSPSDKRNWVLFKAASAYMLGAFACLTLGAVL